MLQLLTTIQRVDFYTRELAQVPKYLSETKNVVGTKRPDEQNVPETKRPKGKDVLHFKIQFFKKYFVCIFLKMGDIC